MPQVVRRCKPGDAGRPVPEPGGWNRIQIEVTDLAAHAEKLREAGVALRSNIIEGQGGKQLIVDDPAGNPVELFEPKD